MKTNKELFNEIEARYTSNRNILDKQFEKATDKNIFSIIVQNVNIIEEDNSFTELDLIDTIKLILSVYSEASTDKFKYFIDTETLVELLEEYQYTWILAKRHEEIGELANEN